MEDTMIYILKEEKGESGDDWCNGLGVNDTMLGVPSMRLYATYYQRDNDILLKICRL